MSYIATRIDENGQEIKLHEAIMEMFLGRKLRSDETVRWKNGDTLDCRRANLFIVTEELHD
jgi:hypothetical protein